MRWLASSSPVLLSEIKIFDLGFKTSERTCATGRNFMITNSHEFWAPAGGGLLLSIPTQNVDQCLRLLAKEGFPQACVIGEVLPADDKLKPLCIV